MGERLTDDRLASLCDMVSDCIEHESVTLRPYDAFALVSEVQEYRRRCARPSDVLQDATVAQIPPATEMLRVRLDKFLPTLDEARVAFSGPPNTEGGA